MNKHKKWTEEEMELLRELYPNNFNKDLVPIFGRTLNSIQQAAIKNGIRKNKDLVKTTYFKKGDIPHNKGKTWDDFMPIESRETALKNLELGWINNKLRLPIGSETKDKDGYVLLKVAAGRWQRKHRYLWEQAHGPVPRGYIVKFKDGNKYNFDLDNLYIQSREGNMLDNTIQRYPPKLIKAMKLLGHFKKTINKNGK